MRITYSPTADALAVDLAPGPAERALHLAPGVTAEFDANDVLIGFEILNASSHYPKAMLEEFDSPVEHLTLAEAAKESGLSPVTLRRQCLDGRIPGARKKGRDWLIPLHELYNYLESRAPQGRPAAKKKARRPRKAKVER